jgi:hypothetical protein
MAQRCHQSFGVSEQLQPGDRLSQRFPRKAGLIRKLQEQSILEWPPETRPQEVPHRKRLDVQDPLGLVPGKKGEGLRGGSRLKRYSVRERNTLATR